MAAPAEDRVVSIVKRLALVFALLVTIGLPLGYFGVAYTSLAFRVERQALVKAGALIELIDATPDLWVYQEQRMEELLLRYPVPLTDERATVRDAAGNSLLTVGTLPDAPVLVRSSPLYDSGRAVGQVEITHSYRALVYGALVAGLLGLLLGVMVYAALLLLPLSALRRVTDALARETVALRASEARFRGLTELSSDWYWEQDREFRLSFHSSGFAQRSGTTSERLLGKCRWEEPNRIPLSCTWDEHRATLEAHEPFRNFEYVRIGDNGQKYFVSLSGVPIYDAEGKFNGYRGVGTNITGRKQADEAIRQLSRKSELLLSSVGQGIYGVDVEGNTTFINPAAERLLGWRAEELLGKLMHGICHHTKPDGSPYPREDCPIYKAFHDGNVHHIDNEVFWRKDGTAFPVEYTSTPIRDENNSLIGAVAVFDDITERKRIEKTLDESEQKYRTMIEQSNDMIWSLNAKGEFTYFNKRSEELTGYQLSNLMDQPFQPVIEEDDLPTVMEAFQKTLGGEPWHYDVRVKKRDGEMLVLSVNTAPIWDAGEVVGTVSFGRDITERKRVEEERKRSAETLDAVMTRLTMVEEQERRAIAIDLHDDLSQLLAAANMKLRSLPKLDDRDDYRQPIREATELVEQAERSARSLSFQISPPVLFRLGLVPALESLAEELYKVYGLTISVNCDGKPKDLAPTVRSVLYRATRELLINVAKHAKVEVAHVDVGSDDGLLVISVTDSGVGFDKGLIEKHTTRAGFGLVSMRERLRLIGGQFDIDTHPGDGTVATLAVPLAGN